MQTHESPCKISDLLVSPDTAQRLSVIKGISLTVAFHCFRVKTLPQPSAEVAGQMLGSKNHGDWCEGF